MKNKNPYYKLDVRQIGTQDISPDQLEKDTKLTEKYFDSLKSDKNKTMKETNGKPAKVKKQRTR